MKAVVVANNGNVWRTPKGLRVTAKHTEIEWCDKAKAAKKMGLISLVELIEPKPIAKKKNQEPEK